MTASDPFDLGSGARADNALPAPGLGAGPPSAPFDLEAMEVHEGLVMEIDADPAAELVPPTDWRMPYLDYLLREVLPADKMEVRRLACRAKSFVVIEEELYKHSHTGILQRCIPIEQGKQLLDDIHSGVCEHHAMHRTLVGNAFRQGFYWPTAVADTEHVVRTYEGCQYYA